jgi:hypothetical protein
MRKILILLTVVLGIALATDYNKIYYDFINANAKISNGSNLYIDNTGTFYSDGTVTLNGTNTIDGSLDITGYLDIDTLIVDHSIQLASAKILSLNGATATNYLTFSTTLQIVGSADILLDPAGGDVDIDAGDLWIDAGNYLSVNGSTGTATLMLDTDVKLASPTDIHLNPTGDEVFIDGGLHIGGTSAVSDNCLLSDGLITGSAGVTSTGAAVNLNVSSNFATNINTGTSTGTVTIGDSTGTQGIVISSGTDDLSLQSTDDINMGTYASACNIAIGNAIGATSIGLTAGTGDVSITSLDDWTATASGAVELFSNSVSQQIVIGNKTTGTTTSIMAANKVTVDSLSFTVGVGALRGNATTSDHADSANVSGNSHTSDLADDVDTTGTKIAAALADRASDTELSALFQYDTVMSYPKITPRHRKYHAGLTTNFTGFTVVLGTAFGTSPRAYVTCKTDSIILEVDVSDTNQARDKDYQIFLLKKP